MNASVEQTATRTRSRHEERPRRACLERCGGDTRRVIVSTGASSAFGRSIALALAGPAVTLVLADGDRAALAEVAAQCFDRGAAVFAVTAEASDRVAVERLAKTAAAKAGRVDVWINNTGVAANLRFAEVPFPDHVKVVSTDLLGILYGTYYALRQFRRQGGGTLINSALFDIAAPDEASYVAARESVAGFCAALRAELAAAGEDHIRLCTLIPSAAAAEAADAEPNATPRHTCSPEMVVPTIIELTAQAVGPEIPARAEVPPPLGDGDHGAVTA
jgi:NADP-dependent 3-hydroxy acid dehydrogenase YdfG